MKAKQMSNEVTNDVIRLITDEEMKNQEADRIDKEIFNNEENTIKTASLIQKFVISYEQHKNKIPLEQWLIGEFSKYPNIWKNQAELENTAQEIIVNVQGANNAKQSLYDHLDKGKSKESWLVKRIENGAGASGVTTVGEYAKNIDEAIKAANEGMRATVFNNNGTMSAARNLDGFIAEQHHVDTFNFNAASQGKPYRAKVLTPEGTTYGKNSMDIGIYNEQGKLVRRYQVKYGQDANATGKLFEKGDYRSQTKIVPKGHAEEINGAQEAIEYEGIQSKPLSKEEAKALQEKAQQEHEVNQYEWNDVNRIDIVKNIGKQVVIGAAITASMQGARILGRRIGNKMIGRENPLPSEDMKEFFESSLQSCKHVGIQVAVSGAIVVAVKNGWLGKLLKGLPAGNIVNAVYVGMENAKIFYKLAKGEIIGPEALDAMGNITTSAAGGIAVAGLGMAKGTAFGAVFGPIGAVIGGFVGGVVGGMAGSKISEIVYAGSKAIVKAAIKTLKSAWEITKEASHKVGRALNSQNWFV